MINIFKNKKATSFIILSIALIIAIILISNGGEEVVIGINSDIKNDQENKASGFQLERDGEKLGIIGVNDLSQYLTTQSKKRNLTRDLADKLSLGFVEANEFNEDPSQGVFTPDGYSIISTSLEDYSNEFGLKKDFITIKDLNIGGDNSQEAILSYYTQYRDTISEEVDKLDILNRLNKFNESKNLSYIFDIIDGYDSLISKMKKIKVPSDFIELHLENINLYISQKSIFGSLAQINDDPLRSLTAINLLEETEDKLSDLGLEFASALEKNGFKIIY